MQQQTWATLLGFAGFATVDNRLTTLEQRTYDLSTRLPAASA